MTTDRGVSFVLSRMDNCPTLEALQRVWESISPHYQKHPLVFERKEQRKKELG